MTNRIQHLIAEIRSKQNVIMHMLEEEKTKNAQSRKTIESLNEKIATLEQENTRVLAASNSMISELEELKNLNDRLASSSESSIVSSSVRSVDHDQIDELVREIEYCIGQLKNNA